MTLITGMASYPYKCIYFQSCIEKLNFESYSRFEVAWMLLNGGGQNGDRDPSLALLHEPLSESSMVEKQGKWA